MERRLDKFKNMRLDNKSWAILGVPMIDMRVEGGEVKPSIRLHASVVRRDKYTPLRKNNIEAVHRSVYSVISASPGDESLRLPRMLCFQNTHKVLMPSNETLAPLRPQLLIPHHFRLDLKFKMPLASLASFNGFSQKLVDLHLLCKLLPDIEMSISEENVFDTENDVSDLVLEDGGQLLDLNDSSDGLSIPVQSRIHNLIRQGRVFVVHIHNSGGQGQHHDFSIQSQSVIRDLIAKLQGLIPHTPRTHSNFVHSFTLKFLCLVPRAERIAFRRYTEEETRQHLENRDASPHTGNWRRLYMLIDPPRVSRAMQKRWLGTVRTQMYEQLDDFVLRLSESRSVSYTIPEPQIRQGLCLGICRGLIKHFLQKTVSEYAYSALMVFPNELVNLVKYVLHCYALGVSLDTDRQSLHVHRQGILSRGTPFALTNTGLQRLQDAYTLFKKLLDCETVL